MYASGELRADREFVMEIEKLSGEALA